MEIYSPIPLRALSCATEGSSRPLACFYLDRNLRGGLQSSLMVRSYKGVRGIGAEKESFLRGRVDIGKAVRWCDLPHRSAETTAYTYADVDTHVLREPLSVRRGQVATSGLYRDKCAVGARSQRQVGWRSSLRRRDGLYLSLRRRDVDTYVLCEPLSVRRGQVATSGYRDKWGGAISLIAPPVGAKGTDLGIRRLIPTRTSTPTSCASPCRCEGDRLRPRDTETSGVARSPSSLRRDDGLYLRDVDTHVLREPLPRKGIDCDLGIRRQVGLPGMEEDRENHKMGSISTTTQFRGSERSACGCVSTLPEPGNERFSPPSSNGLEEGNMLPLTERSGRK